MKKEKKSIWTRLKLWAERKEREEFMSRRMCGDLMCPHCNTWGSNMPNQSWADKESNVPTMNHDRYKCGKCGQWTTWLDLGPILKLDDPAFPDLRVRDTKGNLAYDH